jgi:surfeit locus 1 family protein
VIGRIFSLPGILIGVVIYGLISLGLWQLDRADEKLAITKQIEIAQSSPAKQTSTSIGLIKKEYHNVLLAGHYEKNRQFIYDNQIVNGNAGYYILTPFILSDQQAILINRGFVPWHGRRDRIADIEINPQPRVIKVSLIKPVERIELEKHVKLPEFPLLIQSINMSQLEALSELSFVPIIGRLDKMSTDGFFRQWKPFYGSSDKHLGYALQWFLMAFVLFIIALKLLRRG